MSSPAEPASEANLTGRRLGDYQLLRRLGHGAMAEVYLAEQTSLRRQVAIKVLKTSLANDELFIQRFQREAQAAASLVHANIVQIHEVGCCDGIHYIAQEYVEGQNLRELVTRHGPPDLRGAVTIMRQVALALQKAAEQGLVHRDIKPENILLSRSGEVKVADFGLARVVRSDLNLTEVGITLGTPLYMSPEQVEGRPLDPRSDLYSFGVTCYHMLAGHPPFTGETALAVAVQHLHAAPPRLEQARPDLPPALARIIHKMLAKDPDARYSSTRDMLVELRGVPVEGLDSDWWEHLDLAGPALGGVGRLAVTQQLATVMRTQALVTQRKRSWRRIVALAVVIAAFVGAGIGWFTREPWLLAGARVAEIPRQDSARSQFFFAQLQPENREAWLNSVERYFPDDAYYAKRAQQELAQLYLQQGRLDDALGTFTRLADRSDGEPEFRAFGLAGQSIVLTMQDKHTLAAQKLAEVAPLRQKLDPRMSQLLLYPLSVARREMDQKTAQDWDEWKRTLPPVEEVES